MSDVAATFRAEMPFSRTTTARRQRGDGAELAAREWLARRGFEILATNYATRYGELDIVAREGDVVSFVEVRCRSQSAFGSPMRLLVHAPIDGCVTVGFGA